MEWHRVNASPAGSRSRFALFTDLPDRCAKYAAGLESRLSCRDRGWQFCFIGGLALQRWGEPRLIGDIDLTILTGFGHETAYINELCDT